MHTNTARNAHVSHVAEMQSNDMFAQFTRHCIERTNKRNHLSLKGFFRKKKITNSGFAYGPPEQLTAFYTMFLEMLPSYQ